LPPTRDKAAADPAKPGAKSASFDAPITIDGVETMIGKPFIAPLPTPKNDRYSIFKLPEGKFLQLKIKMRNVSETKIVVIQTPWKETLLIDEHKNRMAALCAGLNMNSALDDLAPHGRLRPGQSVDGLLAFEPPIDAANSFQIESDPAIFVPEDAVILRQLSTDSFTLRFTRSEITSRTP
jgi:hypothetical protein